MYKIIYFDGNELALGYNIKLRHIIAMADKNPNIYQIARNNRVGNIVWEREECNE